LDSEAVFGLDRAIIELDKATIQAGLDSLELDKQFAVQVVMVLMGFTHTFIMEKKFSRVYGVNDCGQHGVK
jgi:hypothetical protein